MTTVRFDLEPHQWPPHAQGDREGFADVIFRVEWDGQEVEVEVAARLVQISDYSVSIFFRALDSSQIYVVATPYGICLSPRWHHLVDQESKIIFLKEQLAKVLKNEGFAIYGRLLPFHQSENNRTNLFIAHDRTSGAWVGESSLVWTPFHTDSEADLTHESLENPNSLAGYALRWSQLSHAEQCARAVCFANGDCKEFRAIVRAAVYFGAPALDTQDLTIFFNSEFSISISNPLFHNSLFYPIGVRLRRWGAYIERHFAPHRNQTLAARHLCVANKSLEPLVQFALPQPTQHERLEAALLLREWVEGKIPAREARLLLPKL